MNYRSLIQVGVVLLWFVLWNTPATGQEANDLEAKKALVHEFRKLTGADTVNMNLDITLDGTKKELANMVTSAEGLSLGQRAALEKAVAEAGTRLDAHLKSFMDDRSKFTDLAESAVFEMYDKAFTSEEVRQLIAYYKTDLGQKGLKFLRSQNTEFNSIFQNRIIPVLSDFIKPKIKAESDQLDQMIREAVSKPK